jgi:aliphatic sulfonates family ABC transporter substrate-binding protein
MDKGFYEKVGIEVTQQVFMSGIPEAEALAAGELDIAFMGSTPGLIVGSTGLPIKFLTNVSTFVTSLGIYVQPDSGIKTIFDLKGKKMAYTKGSTGHYMVDLVLDKAGLQEKEIKLINMEMEDIAATFKSKQVDACCVWEPWNFVIEKHGGKALIDASMLNKPPGKIIHASIGDAVLASGKILNEKPELVRKFFLATYEALAWSRKNIDESAQIASNWFAVGGAKIPVAQCKISVDSMYINPDLEMQVTEILPNLYATLRQQSAFLMNVGKLKKVKDPKEFVDLTVIFDVYAMSKK